MEENQARHILFNAQMAEHDDGKLVERELAQLAAAEELTTNYLDKQPEGTVHPDFFNDAIWYATTFVYQTKTPIFHPDDVKREIERKIGFRKKDDESWYPQTDEELNLAVDLILTATHLGDKDEVPAFGPHINGRPTEVMDDPTTQYNKYGLRIFPR